MTQPETTPWCPYVHTVIRWGEEAPGNQFWEVSNTVLQPTFGEVRAKEAKHKLPGNLHN